MHIRKRRRTCVIICTILFWGQISHSGIHSIIGSLIIFQPSYLMSSEHVILRCREIVTMEYFMRKFSWQCSAAVGKLLKRECIFFKSRIISYWNINCNEYARVNLDISIWTFSTSQVVSLIPIKASQIAIIFLHYYFHELILF